MVRDLVSRANAQNTFSVFPVSLSPDWVNNKVGKSLALFCIASFGIWLSLQVCVLTVTETILKNRYHLLVLYSSHSVTVNKMHKLTRVPKASRLKRKCITSAVSIRNLRTKLRNISAHISTEI